MKRNAGSARIALASVLGVVAALAPAQRTSGQDVDRQTALRAFYAPVDVPLVNVEVFVSDAAGRPMAGLGVGDFEVFEDGKPVVISHFYAAPGVALNDAPAEPQPLASEAPAAATAAVSQDQYLVVLVDDTNLSRGRRQAALDHVREFVAHDLPTKMQVLIANYDGALHIRQPFSEDNHGLVEAIEALRGHASLSRDLEQDRILREIENSQTSAAFAGSRAGDVLESASSGLEMQIRSYAEENRERARATVTDLKRFVRSLSGIPGRKALLLVSDGVEPRPGERLFAAYDRAFGEGRAGSSSFITSSRYDVSSEYEELSRYANGQRVTFFTLSSLAEKAMRGMSAEYRGDLGGFNADLNAAVSADQLMTGMAAATGGRALSNSPGLDDQLDEVAEELASYYSLGFAPDHVGDGKYHRLEVRVRREGAQVRHREGYLDTGEIDRLDDRTLAAVVHGSDHNPLGIAIECGEVIPRDDGSYLVPVMIRVPIGKLVLLPDRDEHTGRIAIVLAVRDARGGMAPMQRREYPIPVDNDQIAVALNSSAGFTLRLAVGEGLQRIAVGVLDQLALVDSVATVEINVGNG